MNMKQELRRGVYQFLKSGLRIERYDQMKTLSVAEWEEQWAARFVLRIFLNLRNSDGDERVDEQLRQFVMRLFIDPILSSDNPLTKGSLTLDTRYPAVRGLTATDIYNTFELLSDEEFDDVASACRKGIFRSEEDRELCWTDLDALCMERRGEPWHTPLLTVDLNATDEQIMNDFRRWLDEERRTRVRVIDRDAKEMRKDISEKDISKWVQFRVAAYVDIILVQEWLRTTNAAKLTDPQTAELLFPDEYEVDRVSRLRKVVQKEAGRVMSSGFLDKLKTQVERLEGCSLIGSVETSVIRKTVDAIGEADSSADNDRKKME